MSTWNVLLVYSKCSRRLQVVLSIVLMSSMLSTSAYADRIERIGLWNLSIPAKSGPNDVRHRSLDCTAGEYLVGLVKFQTDRLVDLATICVAATKDQEWADTPVQAVQMFSRRSTDAPQGVTCPKNYFLVGLAVTVGTYSTDSHGAASPVPPDLIADLRPVCRNGKVDDIFVFPPGRLRQADDNDLNEIAWDGLDGARSCKAGYAAVSLKLVVDSRRDIDPDRPFENLALVCDRLPVNISNIAGGVVTP